MKKLIALLLTIVLLTFSLASCGNETDKDAVKVVDIPLTEEEYAFCVAPGNTELLETVNAFLKQSKENGVFDTIVNNYFGDGTPVGYEMGTVGDRSKQLVVATNTPFEPYETLFLSHLYQHAAPQVPQCGRPPDSFRWFPRQRP